MPLFLSALLLLDLHTVLYQVKVGVAKLFSFSAAPSQAGRDAAVHVRSVNVQKAKMQPTNVRPKQTLTDKKEV